MLNGSVNGAGSSRMKRRSESKEPLLTTQKLRLRARFSPSRRAAKGSVFRAAAFLQSVLRGALGSATALKTGRTALIGLLAAGAAWGIPPAMPDDAEIPLPVSFAPPLSFRQSHTIQIADKFAANPDGKPGNAAPAVPQKYRDLYDELDRILAASEEQLPADPGSFCPLFATNLTAANANRGPMILKSRVRKAILANLDAFKAVGLTAVALSIPYPVLVDDFPRSRQYRDFYRWVAEQARSRGFALFVESGTAFRPPLGAMPVTKYYRGLSPERYMRGKRQMVEWMVRFLQPEYLTLENEPDTQTMITGMEFTPDRVVQFVNHFLKDLDPGRTKIGAGAGTWLPPVYLQRLAAETPVDYLDIHIYPVNRNFFLPRALEAAEIATRYNKALIVGEAWLYKMRNAETGRKAAELQIFARDAYSFWAPLDARFIQIVAKFARAKQVALVSFFWPQFLFGYAPYSPKLDARPPHEISEAAVRAAVPNILAKRLSPTGEALRNLATASCPP